MALFNHYCIRNDLCYTQRPAADIVVGVGANPKIDYSRRLMNDRATCLCINDLEKVCERMPGFMELLGMATGPMAPFEKRPPG